MKGVDAHQHFWTYDSVQYDWISEEMAVLKKDFGPSDLKPLLEEQGLKGCVAVQARQTEAENDFLLDLALKHPHVLGVVGWLDLQADNLEERLDAYRPFGSLKGIRHIVQAEPDPEFLLRDAFIRGIKLLAKVGLTYDILVFEQQFPAVIRFLERCPDQSFVLDHLGKPKIDGGPTKNWIEGIRTMAAHPNVYCKLSGLVTEANWKNWEMDDFKPFLEVAVEAFGTDRIMIGSDWPVCLLAAEQYASVIDILAQFSSQWIEEERNLLFGGNAENFYNL
jgi:L-fuconolactonase